MTTQRQPLGDKRAPARVAGPFGVTAAALALAAAFAVFHLRVFAPRPFIEIPSPFQAYEAGTMQNALSADESESET